MVTDLTLELLDLVVLLLDCIFELCDFVASLFNLIALELVLLDELLLVVKFVLNALNMELELLLDFNVISHLSFILNKLALVYLLLVAFRVLMAPRSPLPRTRLHADQIIVLGRLGTFTSLGSLMLVHLHVHEYLD